MVANTGPLINTFGKMFSDKEKSEAASMAMIEAMDRNDGKIQDLFGYKVVVINVAAIENTDFARKYLGKILASELWTDCDSCPKKEYCHILRNQKLILENLERVCEFIENYYIWQNEYGYRLTIRSMTEQIAYMMTAGDDCEDIKPHMTHEKLLASITDLTNDASRKEILFELDRHNENTVIKKDKSVLSMEVPFHFLSSFLTEEDRKILRKIGTSKSVLMLNSRDYSTVIPYTFSSKQGLEREIVLDKSWQSMLLDNIIPLRGWIQYEKIKYLQERNPDAHGIIYKLDAAKNYTRKLSNARTLWSAFLDIEPFYDIYTDRPLTSSVFDLDHFIPWSFLTSDELWDLIPADGAINSKKRNHLPSWNKYFEKFGRYQYKLYKKIYSTDAFYKLFKNCQKDNLKTYWGGELLYIRGKSETEFITTLSENLRPQYDAALRQGFSEWLYSY